MKISKKQLNSLPEEYKKYFIKEEGGFGECKKNIHPTL